MGIESLTLDAEGEYSVVADALGGINVVISPTSKTIINLSIFFIWINSSL